MPARRAAAVYKLRVHSQAAKMRRLAVIAGHLLPRREQRPRPRQALAGGEDAEQAPAALLGDDALRSA